LISGNPELGLRSFLFREEHDGQTPRPASYSKVRAGYFNRLLDQYDALQIQVPSDFDVKENLCLPLLFSLVFDSAEVWWPLWLKISSSLSATGSFSETVKGWTVEGSLLGRDVVLRFTSSSIQP
jgi:hypothetical protein